MQMPNQQQSTGLIPVHFKRAPALELKLLALHRRLVRARPLHELYAVALTLQDLALVRLKPLPQSILLHLEAGRLRCFGLCLVCTAQLKACPLFSPSALDAVSTRRTPCCIELMPLLMSNMPCKSQHRQG